MNDIVARESNLMIMYKITTPRAGPFVVAVSIISSEQGRDIIRGFTADYVLIIPISPPGAACPFLRAMRTDASYVARKTGLSIEQAELLAAIMPELSSMAPPDDILDAANAFLEKESK